MKSMRAGQYNKESKRICEPDALSAAYCGADRADLPEGYLFHPPPL